MQFGKKTVENYVSNSVRELNELSTKSRGKRFNKVLNYFESLFYPDLIIVGGGISKKMDKFEEFLKIKTKLIPAQLMNEAGIIGAAVYAAEK
jgi:polyphosphate glucokinase